jgi:MinD superfamily P-loop ATPase
VKYTRAFTAVGLNNMKIAVLSGKGGTGKTLVSVNLAAAAERAAYVDCDIEEPNGNLFFKAENILENDVNVKIPEVDKSFCNGCRKCVDFCKFNALAYIKELIVFEEVCHSCGGCMLVCPENAITEKDEPVGKIQKGISGGVSVYTGIMNIGEASGVPIIKKLLSFEKSEGNELTIIDSPPGSACNVMESIQDVDYCILVAEPTLFGVHNLSMVHELVKIFNKPFGAVLNKCLDGENPAEKYCKDNNIKILAKIPYDTELGKLNSDGEIIVRKSEKYRDMFSTLLNDVIEEAQNAATVNT